MIILERANKYPYVFIKGRLPKSVKETIDDELSYYVEGYEHSNKYQCGKWDGKVHMFGQSRTGGYYFPSGLISRVRGILSAFEIQHRIRDTTTTSSVRLDLDWNDKYDLREYQVNATTSALQAKQGVISLPTGGGKTLIGLRLIYLINRPAIITVHTGELFYQWERRIKEVLNYSPGLVGDGHSEWKNITVAMMQTATKLNLPPFDVLVQDECHHAPCDQLFGIAMQCNAKYRFGLSATPHREDNADLKIWGALGEICANVTPEQLIDEGYLARPRFIFLDPPIKRLSPHNWQKAYNEGIVKHVERNDMIVKMAQKLIKEGRQVYIHVVRIAHGKVLAGMLECPFLHGRNKTETRQDTIKRFESGELRVLVSTLLGEGVDIPEIDAIILAHGQKTSIGTVQKMGRALRMGNNKKEAIIVDFKDKGRYISEHWENRYRTYAEYYGKYLHVEDNE